MAYRAELSDGKSTNTQAPIDEDSHIRCVVIKKQKVCESCLWTISRMIVMFIKTSMCSYHVSC